MKGVAERHESEGVGGAKRLVKGGWWSGRAGEGQGGRNNNLIDAGKANFRCRDSGRKHTTTRKAPAPGKS